MGFTDLPAHYEFPKHANEDVRMERSAGDEARERLSIDSIYLLANNSAKKSKEAMNINIENIGALDSMTLPNGWSQGEEKSQIGGLGNSRQFTTAGNKDIELTIFDRGRRYESNSAAFKSILTSAPHSLSDSEKESLGAILGNYNDSRVFAMTDCKTQDLNGKRVLVIAGKWSAAEHESYSILVNPDGEGSNVQEIYFKAPTKQYKLYLPQAMQSINSIKWK